MRIDFAQREQISIHTPREGSDRPHVGSITGYISFQSTLPARGATAKSCTPATPNMNFNPHSPRGERRHIVLICYNILEFQSTLPARGATPSTLPNNCDITISIHTPREGSDLRKVHPLHDKRNFNPHSPRGERRRCRSPSPKDGRNFNPHSPRGERPFTRQTEKTGTLFQSTLPARGATDVLASTGMRVGISIHTPREGSDASIRYITGSFPISIHTPREGSDGLPVRVGQRGQFQSTLPARGATWGLSCADEGGSLFQSTLPARGATCSPSSPADSHDISIHTPREGSDRKFSSGWSSLNFYFNPHSPRGERQRVNLGLVTLNGISIHTPREGSDRVVPSGFLTVLLFQSTLPARGATEKTIYMTRKQIISIHTPREGSDFSFLNSPRLTV